jgi:hypothetical protein
MAATPDNPFNNLNNTPDHTITALAAGAFWLTLAAILAYVGPPRLQWPMVAALTFYAGHTWRRFRVSPK